MEEKDFYIGQRIVFTDSIPEELVHLYFNRKITFPATATVRAIPSHYYSGLGVAFDEPMDGHVLDGNVPVGHGWWIPHEIFPYIKDADQEFDLEPIGKDDEIYDLDLSFWG